MTSERGTVARVDPAGTGMVLRLDDGRAVSIAADAAGIDRLDYGYATTVHRNQGDTTGVARRFADGGGRELGYVSMSRATGDNSVYVVADDIDQARADLIHDWSGERRQRWAIDTGTPTSHAAEIEHTATVDERTRKMFRIARLEAEERALRAAIPPDVTSELHLAHVRAGDLERRRRGVETGSDGEFYRPEGRAGFDVGTVRQRLRQAEYESNDRRLSRVQRRNARSETERLRPRLDAVVERWQQVAGPRHARLTADLEQTRRQVTELDTTVQRRADWLEQHPEALSRLDSIEQELATLRPKPAIEPQVVGLVHRLGRIRERRIGSPELGL